MRITLIGGVERNERALSKIAQSLGHELDFHGGHMNGRGVEVMERQIERSDLVLVTTDVNSHTAVMVADFPLRQRSSSVAAQVKSTKAEPNESS